MPDLGKVIKGLQIERECVSRDCDRDCGKCDLVQDRDWLLSVYDEAIALLKEQEAVEPVTESSVYDPDTWFFVCGSCKKGVIERGDKFCRWCGRAVKWE